MEDSLPTAEVSAPFHFRIGPRYITWWIHEFEHWNTTEKQRQAVTALSEAFHQLLKKRDQVQTARGLFGAVSIYSPLSGPTQQQQQDLFYATQEFFSSYYVAVSAFSALIKRHWDVFGDSPNNSNSKFLKWWKSHGLFMDDAHPILESARGFRAMLSHPESYPPHEWHTANDEGLIKIVLAGAPSGQDKIPDGTERRDDMWVFLAPDEDLVTSALAVQLNAAIPAIKADKPKSSAMRCTWQLESTPDDLPDDFPIFAPKAGVVEDLITQAIETSVTVTNSSGEQVHLDED